MRKLGIAIMWTAFWIAVLGLYLSEPAGNFAHRHIISFALQGLEIRMFPLPDDPATFRVHIVAADWLLGSLLIFLVGAALVGLAYRQRRRQRHHVQKRDA